MTMTSIFARAPSDTVKKKRQHVNLILRMSMLILLRSRFWKANKRNPTAVPRRQANDAAHGDAAARNQSVQREASR
jgi:hypothetical protein